MSTLARLIKHGAIIAGLAVLTPNLALGDDRDSNADATFGAAARSSGALIRVPINANGDEDTNAAELRVVDDSSIAVTADALPNVWGQATAMAPITVAPADSSADSSTSWWGWNRWGGWGWRSPYYYYNNYTPYFNYYGNYYNYSGYSYPSYSYPYYNNYYYPYNNYYGYRYYYYPRYYW